MKSHRLWITCASLLTVSLASGCGGGVGTPLFFGQAQTVGITIATAPQQGGGELTLGYRDTNIAVIPVSVSQGDGKSTQLKAKAGAGHEDTLSVLGQFEVEADGTAAKVGLGKFFATGLAAKTLADGFKAKMSK